jgi:hypothetical protein
MQKCLGTQTSLLEPRGNDVVVDGRLQRFLYFILIAHKPV